MRENKFRGICIATGNWHYGDLVTDGEARAIVTDARIEGQDSPWVKRIYEVVSSTVGQYTGLKDKNGREIYGGDVVKKIETTGYTFEGEVVYEEYGFGIKPYGFFSPLSKKGKYDDGKSSFDYSVEYEIIGRIHENPELLGDSR